MLSKVYKPKLVNRWLLTVAGIPKVKSTELLEWSEHCWLILKTCYNQPHRHYHNFDHIRDMLRKADVVNSNFENETALELAIWFHDSIFDPLSKFNEEASAKLAYDLILKLGDKQKDLAEMVSELIMFTKWSADTFFLSEPDEIKKHYKHASRDFLYLRDIDWSGFGSSWKNYEETNVKLRNECHFIDDFDYYTNRYNFLNMVLDIERPLYCTTFYRDRIGYLARKNILKEKKKLTCLLKI